MKRAVFAILAIGLGNPRETSEAQTTRAPHPPVACRRTVDAQQWSDRSGRRLFIESPSLAVSKEFSLIAGFPALLYEHAPPTTAREVRLGVIEEKGRGFIPVHMAGRPRERYWPRAAAAGGLVHVVWGEDTAVVESQIPRVRQLWYMNHDGTRWSAPEKIWGPASVTWDPGAASDLHATRSGVALALPAIVGRESGVLYLERRRERWISTFIVHRGLPGQAELAPVANGTSVVSLIAADVSARRSNGNSVFTAVIKPVAGGARADAIERVHYSGLGAAWSPRIHELDRGKMALMWLQADSGMNRATRVLAATSSGGVRWREVEAISFPDGLEGLHSSASRRSVHLVSTRAQRGAEPVYMEWTEGRWSTAVLLTNATAQTAPRMLDDGHTAFAVWSSAVSANVLTRERVPVTWRVRVPLSCRHP
jgi:hypothetical protein